MELSRKGFIGALAMTGAFAGCTSIFPPPKRVPDKKTSQTACMPSKFKPMQILGLSPKPPFWKVRPDEIIATCAAAKMCYRKEIICRTPLGYPVYALFYGKFDDAAPQANWPSGRDSRTYRNYYGRRTDGRQTVVLIAGIHGAEPESTVNALNLIQMIERGVDFRGKRDPELMRLLEGYRLIVVPCVNMDGRSISPDHLRGVDWDQYRRASQGVWKVDNSLIGWRGSKSWFPLPLAKVAYPGGYPNANGYNIDYDCVPGDIRTAEAKALLNLVARWRADLIITGHSHASSPIVAENSGLDYPARFQRTSEIRFACNMALHRARLLASFPDQPEEDEQDTTDPSLTLDEALKNACGGLSLRLKYSVSYDKPERPPLRPTRCYSFSDLMTPGYIVLKAALKNGLERPFVVRGDESIRVD